MIVNTTVNGQVIGDLGAMSTFVVSAGTRLRITSQFGQRFPDYPDEIFLEAQILDESLRPVSQILYVPRMALDDATPIDPYLEFIASALLRSTTQIEPANVIIGIDVGSILTICARTGPTRVWYRVELDGREGWVAQDSATTRARNIDLLPMISLESAVNRDYCVSEDDIQTPQPG
ncbi:MAG: hypothetical protein IPK19_01375 [Chloroflexi bacterium]|nr:hypothetical protein [Chloroflexota bacterium]